MFRQRQDLRNTCQRFIWSNLVVL